MTADRVAATRRLRVGLAVVLSVTFAVACLAGGPAADAQEKPRYAPGDKPKSAPEWVRPADEVGPVFWVYDDKGIDYIGSGYMPDGRGVAQSVKFEAAPHKGTCCIQARYKLADNPWVGVAFLLDGKWEQHKRKLNVFTKSEAQKGDPVVLRFWARSPDGSVAKFGVGSDKDTVVFPIETDWIKLGKEFTQYEIDLTGADLSSVVVAFTWVMDRENNEAPNKPTAEIHIDTVYFTKLKARPKK